MNIDGIIVPKTSYEAHTAFLNRLKAQYVQYLSPHTKKIPVKVIDNLNEEK